MAEPTFTPQLRVLPGFAVPFGELELPNAGPLNAELRALFLAREHEGPRYRNPAPSMTLVPQVFESKWDLFYWTDPCVVKLRELCNAALFKMVGELNGYSKQELAELILNVDAWFHVTRPGGTFGWHNHPMASWSGVYCVDSGYGDGEPQSGELIFSHPAPAANMFVDLGVANIQAPWSLAPRQYRLRPGQLVLFPSWVLHQVMPFSGPSERVTVAFNVWFRKAP
jgi:uncharacterized protein (TIGR02466 family)